MRLSTTGNAGEQCDAPKSRIGRFLMVNFLAATSVMPVVRAQE